MAIDFPSSPTVGQVYTFAGVTYVFTAQGIWSTGAGSSVLVGVSPPQGRLTLVSATPVMTTNQLTKTTIYYTPYVGNQIPIWNGTVMVMTPFNELSVATTDATKSPAAIGASKVNDWFVWNDAGTLRLGHGPDWSSDTGPRTLGFTTINGIRVNGAPITNGPALGYGTYVGTTKSAPDASVNWQYGALGAGGVAAYHMVWNAYNRVEVTSLVQDLTATFSVAASQTNMFNLNAGNRVNAVFGLAEDAVLARVNAGGTSSQALIVCVGYDQIAVSNGTFSGIYNTVPGGSYGTMFGEFGNVPDPGAHFWQMLQSNDAGGGTMVGHTVLSYSGLLFRAKM